MTFRATQQRASIFHGYGATPEDHWFGWLADQLSSVGIPTAIPALPNPLDPEPEQWERVARSTLGTIDEHSIVVAHSLGCLTALRALRSQHSLPGAQRLGTLVLVAGFIDPLPALPQLDAYIEAGCDPEELDVTSLSARVDRITVLRSDHDPFVPTVHTDRLAELLGASAQVVPGAGHFLAADGVTSLREVRDAIIPRCDHPVTLDGA